MTLRTQILDKVEDLFMRYGMKSVTMDDIARELGISKKTLYQHTDTKFDLIRHIIVNHIKKDTACILSFKENSKDAIEELCLTARYVADILKKMNPRTLYDLKKYYRKQYDQWEQFHKEHVYSVVKENIERGRQEGYYREDFNVDIVTKLYVSKTLVLVNDDYFPASEYQRDHVFIEHLAYHVQGIATRKGLRLFEKYKQDYPDLELIPS